ncbi:unnamed protein product [Plutella xylostella]|uniref:Mediator of RNA polymerase II transcription subunit 16 n=1 Tax=Plutella xylostella TaxID=51655 RepID=A0A8S4FZM2_PLUXY|nr:unnamed protein product [Plutella xylostella]
MELIYSMRRKPLKCEPPLFESSTDPEVTRPICTISCANIIAFSSPTELTDSDGATWGGHVYVCDLDTPWDSHKVASTTHPVSVLEWDSEGKELLVATTIGDVSVFVQKEYLLNEWTCVSSVSFPGENIIKAVFFTTGHRYVLSDKKPDAPIHEKIQLVRTTPTLKGFGGVATPGVCVVTASGVVGTVIDGVTSTESLRTQRDKVTAAAIAAPHNGKLIIAYITGSVVRGVSCSITARGASLQPLPALCLPPHAAPATLTWCMRDDSDSLVVAGGSITMWKLTERAYPVHKLLSKGPVQGGTTPGGGPKPASDCFNTLVWHQTAAWASTGRVVCSRARRTAAAVALATQNQLTILCRMQVISTPVVTGTSEPAGASPPKKQKHGSGLSTSGTSTAVISCVDISRLGGAVLAIDSRAQLHVFKLLLHSDCHTNPLSLQQTSNLLEYSIVSGIDCMDVLITLKPPALEALYDRLTETFQRQPPAFQQYYYQSWLKLRCTLLRLIPSQQASASALTSYHALQLVWAGAAAALRLDERSDAAARALADDTNDEKSLLALESLREVPGGAELGALRRPLRRAADTAAAALAAAAAREMHKYSLHSDPTAINLIRKLLVLGRACGGADCLQRPLARLANSNTPAPDLIEECASLTAQLSTPRVWDSLPRCCVSSHERNGPLYFEYGLEPEALRCTPEPPASNCDTTPTPTMDAMRYMYLGGRPARWRQCGRCGARALAAALPNKHPLHKAYDGRFMASCRCGGKWTLCSNI